VAESERERKRTIGEYVVEEHTARRLVAESRRQPLVVIGVIWAAFLPAAALLAPWRGGARLFIIAASAVVLAVVTLLVGAFAPLVRRVIVDVETGECRVECSYLFRWRRQFSQVPLAAVSAVRRRRRVWQDPGDVTKVEWVVELLGQEEVWLVAAGDKEEPLAELARLVAEVAGCPLQEA